MDVVFPVLHGPFGEDGTVQGLLELADVAYVGPGVAASAVAMDKDLFKAVMRANDIPVTRSVTVLARARDRIEHPFELPVVIKPARLGSSVGITLARTAEELARGIDLAFEYDEKVLIEEYVSGIEVECSVLGNEEPLASLVGEIVPLKADWYDYASKYDDGGMDLVVPARITPEQAARAQELAVRSFVACDCEGMARVDMFVSDDRRGARQRAEHDPRLHLDERLREAARGVRYLICGAATPPGRARGRTARAPRRAAVLNAGRSRRSAGRTDPAPTIGAG